MAEASEGGARIVLFGAAGAGKSSLLGALAQAGQTDREALAGQLADPGGGLAELEQQTYDNKPIATQAEVVPYPVIWQQGVAFPLTLIDCNGEAAREYLEGKRSLADRAPLADAVRQADALVLAAPAEASQLDRDLGQCAQFLRLFEELRGRRSDVAGLPVFLVLTKTDLLARSDDTAASWLQRIEQTKLALGKGFGAFLQRRHGAPFGKIDLRLGAVAVKQPALIDRPARPREPYGVGELFHQVIPLAWRYHEARQRSQRRLHGAVMSLAGLIAIMGLVAAGFFLSRPSAELAALENSIRAALPAASAPAAERLREPLAPRLKELIKIEQSPEFDRLPAPMRAEVDQAVQEMSVYQELANKVDSLKRVRFFKQEEDIQTYTRELQKIVLPEPQASQWTDTRLIKRMQQYQRELAALTKAVSDEKDWLKKQTEEGDQLRRMEIPAEGSPQRQAWISRADAFLKRKDLAKDVPNVSNMKLRELYEFPTVSRLREDFESVRSRVDKIRAGLANS